jgi:serine/threonine protein kinase
MGVMAYHMLTGSLPFTAVMLDRLLQMQVEQEPPDIRLACPGIDSEFARFIECALCKEPDERISDWEEIRGILRGPNQLELILDPDELAVVIRFRDTEYQHSARLINAMQKMLREEGINHDFELRRGDS